MHENLLFFPLGISFILFFLPSSILSFHRCRRCGGGGKYDQSRAGKLAPFKPKINAYGVRKKRLALADFVRPSFYF